jgi:16S rRNA (guanine966-N2)-methyltransferase
VRIIGGALRGRKLRTFKGTDVRPTADRVREALFNILGRKIKDADVLDLFAGTGALGIEALSRGSRKAVFVDTSARSLDVLSKNLDHCALLQCSTTIQWDISRNLTCLKGYPETFNLVFMDPPYHHDLVPMTLQHLLESGCLASEALLIAEHEAGPALEIQSSRFTCTDSRRYGRTALSFFTYPGPLAFSPMDRQTGPLANG